jgi:uncharacterized membrane protein
VVRPGSGSGIERDRELPGVERLLALSDGVVAIALTLLTLSLEVPARSAVHDVRSASDLASVLSSSRIIDQFTSYVVAFFVVATFWFVHYRTFRMVRGHDEGLAWWNFGYLFAITLVPFTTNLQGRFSNNPLAVAIFSADLLLVSLFTQAAIRYARHRGLLVRGLSEREFFAGRVRGLGTVLVMLISIGLAWVSTDAARYVFFLLIVVGRVSSRWSSRRYPESAGAGPSSGGAPHI